MTGRQGGSARDFQWSPGVGSRVAGQDGQTRARVGRATARTRAKARASARAQAKAIARVTVLPEPS